MNTRTKVPLTILALVLLGAGVGAYRAHRTAALAPDVALAPVTTGDIVASVKATGTLYPTRTVDIGTEVSGIVSKMYVDFNSIVHKGQVVAQLDDSVENADLESAKAAVLKAQIDLDQERQVLENDRRTLTRTEALLTDQVASQQERDDANVQVRVDEAQITQDEAAITVADANVKQAEVNLSYCTIISPIDGVVIARNADVGQAVAARMQVPSLYTLGTDLTHLQLVADVDEADISQVAVGEPATFTVETYPGVRFPSMVKEVRLNATSNNDVVTYQVVIDAPNADLRLKPGMTVNAAIEISEVHDVVTVPNAALQFHPTREAFAALNETAPAAFKLAAPPQGGDVQAAQASPANGAHAVAFTSAQTIDEILPPHTTTTFAGQVWTFDQHRLAPVSLELGITDGTRSQVLSGNVTLGESLVTRVTLPGAPQGPTRPGGLFAPPGRGFGRRF